MKLGKNGEVDQGEVKGRCGGQLWSNYILESSKKIKKDIILKKVILKL